MKNESTEPSDNFKAEYFSDEFAYWSARADAAASKVRAESTLKAYTSDWADFQSWCDRLGQAALPALPKTVAAYMRQLVDRDKSPAKPATVRRRLAAISVYHQQAGMVPPTASALVREQWKAIRRSKGVAPTQKQAILEEDLEELIRPLDTTTLAGLRDRAIILLGFASAMRRSELVALEVEDIEIERPGAVFTIRWSKTNQEGEAEFVAVFYGKQPATCPVRALEAWLAAAGIRRGPIFREIDRHGNLGTSALTPRVVAMVVKQVVSGLGKNAEKFAGHSLRRGFVTSSARAGASDREIMKQTRHRSRAMIDRYMQAATIWDNHPQTRLKL